MSKAAPPGDSKMPDRHTHLETDNERLVCEGCGSRITVDPHTGVEYGHARKQYLRLPDTQGRCPHRPPGVDPHGAFGRSKKHEANHG